MLEGTLHIVSTPIGNLGDMSPRAIETLRDCAVIAAEDTRHTQKLLTHFEIKTPLVSYHEHNEASRAEELIQRLRDGEDVAIVSDAGTPSVSDPGQRIVAAAHEAGVSVCVVPGPCAAVAALSLCGFPADRFVFHGFMPRKAQEIAAAVSDALSYPATHIFYESPNRIAKTLRRIAETHPTLPVAVVREITKVHEEAVRGTAAELAECFAEGTRGECVLLLDTAVVDSDAEEVSDDTIRERVSAIMEAGKPHSAAVREVAATMGVPRNRVYQLTISDK